MRNTLTFFSKEFRMQFFSPVAYVVMVGFLLLAGFFFYSFFSQYSQILSYAGQFQDPTVYQQINLNDLVFTPTMENIFIMLLLLVPILTMRLISEEKKQGTDELLLTSPVDIVEFVLGKYLAALAFYALLLVLTFQFPMILARFGSIDFGKVASSYLGLLLLGAAFIALGLFASSVTKSQIVAAMASFSALLAFLMLGFMSEQFSGFAKHAFEYVALTKHFEKFLDGVINTGDILYFITFAFFFVFLSVRSVESTRWR